MKRPEQKNYHFRDNYLIDMLKYANHLEAESVSSNKALQISLDKVFEYAKRIKKLEAIMKADWPKKAKETNEIWKLFPYKHSVDIECKAYQLLQAEIKES